MRTLVHKSFDAFFKYQKQNSIIYINILKHLHPEI